MTREQKSKNQNYDKTGPNGSLLKLIIESAELLVRERRSKILIQFQYTSVVIYISGFCTKERIILYQKIYTRRIYYEAGSVRRLQADGIHK